MKDYCTSYATCVFLRTALTTAIDYNAQDSIWNAWSDAEMRAWLVQQKLYSSVEAADMQRHQLEAALAKSWAAAPDNIVNTWRDSDMRKWLIDNGYMKSDAQAKKDEVRAIVALSCTNTD